MTPDGCARWGVLCVWRTPSRDKLSSALGLSSQAGLAHVTTESCWLREQVSRRHSRLE